MQPTPAVALSELGTSRLIMHVAVFDRLTRGPSRSPSAALEQKLGRETTRLALAATGCTQYALVPHRDLA